MGFSDKEISSLIDEIDRKIELLSAKKNQNEKNDNELAEECNCEECQTNCNCEDEKCECECCENGVCTCEDDECDCDCCKNGRCECEDFHCADDENLDIDALIASIDEEIKKLSETEKNEDKDVEDDVDIDELIKSIDEEIEKLSNYEKEDTVNTDIDEIIAEIDQKIKELEEEDKASEDFEVDKDELDDLIREIDEKIAELEVNEKDEAKAEENEEENNYLYSSEASKTYASIIINNEVYKLNNKIHDLTNAEELDRYNGSLINISKYYKELQRLNSQFIRSRQAIKSISSAHPELKSWVDSLLENEPVYKKVTLESNKLGEPNSENLSINVKKGDLVAFYNGYYLNEKNRYAILDIHLHADGRDYLIKAYCDNDRGDIYYIAPENLKYEVKITGIRKSARKNIIIDFDIIEKI